MLPFSYAQDLTMAMESGLINEASFAFTVERDDWAWATVRRVIEVGELNNVTITARGAYPQTSSQLARSASA
jgi:phage head maturation protease